MRSRANNRISKIIEWTFGVAFVSAMSWWSVNSMPDPDGLETRGQNQEVESGNNPVSKNNSNDDIAEGLDLILNYSFLPRDFHQSIFDQLWKDWPEPLRSQAEKASPDERRQMAYDRFGLGPHPDDANRPMQYVVDSEGYWSINCFSCHGGSVDGRTIEGLPNAQLALETLYADIRRTKKRLNLPLSQMDIGSLAIPMGTTVGTSNAVIFGILLMSYRDKDLNVHPLRLPPFVKHHDMDAPPWWNVSKRDRLYIDGFVEKNHRALVPFVMDQHNSGEQLREWEDKFEKIYAYINSLEPPPYPFEIDRDLAGQGKVVFESNCASCHGTYGKSETYPGRIVDIEDIGTDRVRLDALTVTHRQGYHASWYAHYGEDATVTEPAGYQAPPLNGVWASAPYFHNGSVPTLWHILRPTERPGIWRRPDIKAYDKQKLGLAIESIDKLPSDLRGDLRREYFDTSVSGKSAAGHNYPESLSEAEKRSLLEYLKTL